MNVSGPKTRVTSWRWGQHRDVAEILDFPCRDIPERYYFNVATLEPNVAMFPRGILSTS